MPNQPPEASRRFRQRRHGAIPAPVFGSLQLILWMLWTKAVLGRAYLYVRPALLAEEPVELAGLVIHCLFAGAVGLLVLTVIEMRLEPWRFIDDRS